MELSRLENLLQSKRTPWVVAGLTILLFAIANLPWQLDDYDQAKQAFTSFEMIKEGRWFYQRTPQRIRGNKAAARRLDFSGPFFCDAFMGRGMACTVTSGGDCDLDSAVPRCKSGLRNDCRRDCTERVRIESAEPTPGNARAHRHAAGVRHFSYRLIDLAENPRTGGMGTPRSSLHLCAAHGRDVDQGTDCLCVFAAWHCTVSMAMQATRSCSRGR